MRIQLFRHGHVAGPAALYGKTDIALSSEGRRVLEHAVQGADTPEAIISSPLQRCRHFAESQARAINCPLIIEPGFKEMDFGLWDGKPYSEHSPDWLSMQAFWSEPATTTPPGGETLGAMQLRVVSAWERAVEHPYDRVWMFAHGGVIRLILAHLLHIDWRTPQLYSTLSVGYASRTDIHCHRIDGQLMTRVHAIAVPAVQT